MPAKVHSDDLSHLLRKSHAQSCRFAGDGVGAGKDLLLLGFDRVCAGNLGCMDEISFFIGMSLSLASMLLGNTRGRGSGVTLCACLRVMMLCLKGYFESLHLISSCKCNAVTQWLLWHREEPRYVHILMERIPEGGSFYLTSVTFKSSHAKRKKGLLECRPWF